MTNLFDTFIKNCIVDCIEGHGFDDEKLEEMRRETRETAAEMCAILDDESTEPGIIEAYRPPHSPINDNEMTRVDLPAIGGG
jgi:hypothetical protein